MRSLLLALTFIAMSSCASAPDPNVTQNPPPTGQLVYLPPVARLTLVTAAGERETRQDWSSAAEQNLLVALMDALPQDAIKSTATAHETAKRFAESVSPQLEESQLDTKPSSAPAVFHVVVLVTYDVESSASRLVQGGLNLMFGGMPGPDGLTREAWLIYIDMADERPTWFTRTHLQDPRDPKAARRLINRLIAPSSAPDAF